MPAINQDFAVQSFCFRTIKDNAAVADAVKQIGLDKIEVCAVHADFKDPAAFEGVYKTYTDAGVKIISIGVETLTGNEADDRARFECAKIAGLDHISVHFQPDTFDVAHPLAQELAEEYGVRVGIHNHGGYHWLGNMEMLKHVFTQVGDRIGLCLDTAWALTARMDPVKAVETFGERLFAVHMKDFIFESPTGKHQDVVVGTGNLDLPGLVAACDQVGFNGHPILEYEGAPDSPVPTLKKCVEAIKATA